MEEINVKEARNKISALLDKAQMGEDVMILRHGKRVARLVPVDDVEKRLPDLSGFRASIKVKGSPLSRVVIEDRDMGRY